MEFGIEPPPSYEDMLKDARKAQREDLELAEAMRRLLLNNDFRTYLGGVLAKRIDEVGRSLLEPSGSVDGMVKSEFLKGAMYAFCLSRDLPSVIVQAIGEAQPRPDEGNEDAS
jgi:hypothetical protein